KRGEKKEDSRSPAEFLAAFPDRRSRSVYVCLLLMSPDFRDLLWVLQAFVDVKEIKEEYAKAYQKQRSNWIQTPSVVVSKVTGELKGGSGGHNIAAAVPTFREASDLTAGKVRVSREKTGLVIEYSPKDRDKLPGLVRLAGREARSDG